MKINSCNGQPFWISVATYTYSVYKQANCVLLRGGGDGRGPFDINILFHTLPRKQLTAHNALSVFPQPIWGRAHITQLRIEGGGSFQTNDYSIT